MTELKLTVARTSYYKNEFVKPLIEQAENVIVSAESLIQNHARLQDDYIDMRANRDYLIKENKRMRKLIQKVHKAVN